MKMANLSVVYTEEEVQSNVEGAIGQEPCR
jgi:hypothetical protein